MADDEDHADWLASQFGDEEPEKPARRRGLPSRRQAAEPVQPGPVQPAQSFESPLFPPAAQVPVAPYTPLVASPPAAVLPPAASPYIPPAAAEPPAASGGGFSWGLTPGGASPEPAAPAQPVPSAEPAQPTWSLEADPAPLVEPVQPAAPEPVEPTAPVDPLAGLFGQTPVAPVVPTAPAESAWDVPTVATPVQPEQPAATVAFHGSAIVRQEFPGFGVPVDSTIEGVTEVFGAQVVGLGIPENEGVEVSAIDSLFGDSAFVEYEDTLVPSLPARGSELVVVERPKAPAGTGGLGRTQKILMGVAGGLVGVLLLIVLFLAGTRIAQNAPAPAVADPTPTASAGPVVGPVAPGDYYWDRLLGGECLSPFTSPWEDTFTVVDCTQAHPAQLLYKGTFPATEDPDYPGVDALQKLAVTLCSVPTIIDYAATAGANDIEILASFAADEQDWIDGNRTFYCFANRTGGAQFTASVAVPQPLPTAAATPVP